MRAAADGMPEAAKPKQMLPDPAVGRGGCSLLQGSFEDLCASMLQTDAVYQADTHTQDNVCMSQRDSTVPEQFLELLIRKWMILHECFGPKAGPGCYGRQHRGSSKAF